MVSLGATANAEMQMPRWVLNRRRGEYYALTIPWLITPEGPTFFRTPLAAIRKRSNRWHWNLCPSDSHPAWAVGNPQGTVATLEDAMAAVESYLPATAVFEDRTIETR